MSPRRKTQNNLHISILGFFLKNPHHGYDLFKKINSQSAFIQIWHLKQSQFYAILEAFYQEGFLEIEIHEGDNYPDRKEYHLTEKGRDLVSSWMVSPVKHGREMRQEFLAKLFFSLEESKKLAVDLIKNQKSECLNWIKFYDQNRFDKEIDFSEFMNEYRLIQINGMIEWLDKVEVKINSYY